MTGPPAPISPDWATPVTSSRAVPGPSPRWLVEAALAGRPSFAIAPLVACGGAVVIAVLRITGHPAGPFAASLVEGVLPLGTAIAGVAGGLIVLSYPVQPFVGTEFIIIMYAGVVLGGIGSITGAFWGGMVIGLVQQLSILVLPLQLQNTLVFLVFVLILLLRPQGLFGRSVERA